MDFLHFINLKNQWLICRTHERTDVMGLYMEITPQCLVINKHLKRFCVWNSFYLKLKMLTSQVRFMPFDKLLVELKMNLCTLNHILTRFFQLCHTQLFCAVGMDWLKKWLTILTYKWVLPFHLPIFNTLLSCWLIKTCSNLQDFFKAYCTCNCWDEMP